MVSCRNKVGDSENTHTPMYVGSSFAASQGVESSQAAAAQWTGSPAAIGRPAKGPASGRAYRSRMLSSQRKLPRQLRKFQLQPQITPT